MMLEKVFAKIHLISKCLLFQIHSTGAKEKERGKQLQERKEAKQPTFMEPVKGAWLGFCTVWGTLMRGQLMDQLQLYFLCFFVSMKKKCSLSS